MRKTSALSECVSMDQIESRTSGFIGVLRCFISKKRCTCASIFLDYYCGFTYIHLHTSTNMEETLQTKESFEAYAQSLCVKIRHQYTNNGRFANKDFKQAIQDVGQTISYCRVNAHFQNERAEKKITYLQNKGRTTLLHVIARFP